MPGDSKGTMFNLLGALERFLDLIFPNPMVQRRRRVLISMRYLLDSIRENLYHHFLGSFLTVTEVRGLKLSNREYYYICGLDTI